jgi:enediyne biosynthesis protein E3
LAAIPEQERGFAYEGAGMQAAIRDVVTAGRARAFARLLAGPGDGYVHLMHVGYGWAFARVRLPVPIPATPLLRWLALDGVGFARTYFGGLGGLRRECSGRRSHRWPVRVAGCGRALWFVECADIDGILEVISGVAEPARAELWAGIGLACGYAGCVDARGVDRLVAASARHWPRFGQGALFAITARQRAGIVPAYTERMCRQLFDVEPAEAARWTDEAAQGLTESSDVSAYTEWRSRLRSRIAGRC